jgi:hypothetical protein
MGKHALFLMLAASSALAADDAARIENAFVKPWVEALRSQDRGRIIRFFHPATRACINPSTKFFFDTLLDREIDENVRGSYHVSGLMPMQGAPPALLPDHKFRYPVQPAYQVDVQFDETDLVMTRWVAQSNGSWYEVYPCPSAEGMAFFRKEVADNAKRLKELAQIAADIHDPLRGELLALLRQKKRIDAIHRYSEAAHVNIGTAMQVINALAQSKP